MKKQVNVLGAQWEIEYTTPADCEGLKDCAGYCDPSIRTMFINTEDGKDIYGNTGERQKECVRHEVVHAFLFESGLANNFEHHNRYGHEETMVDWIAIQGSKIYNAWKEVGAL